MCLFLFLVSGLVWVDLLLVDEPPPDGLFPGGPPPGAPAPPEAVLGRPT